MLVRLDVAYDVFHQLAVHLQAFLDARLLGILLNGPYGPEGYVGLLHLVYLPGRLAGHEGAQLFLCRLHDEFEVVLLLDGQCQSGQCDEGVASAALEPRIAGQQVALVLACAVVELMSGVDQTVEEVVARSSLVDLFLEEA